MAYNAASHNATGAKTGPVSGPPPQASNETTAAVANAAAQDPLGQHTSGQDGGDKAAGQKVKSEKERK
jgi:valyl-tRNA synthetase